MAEIKVEKKSPIWPWILLGLIILGVILYFLLANGNDDTDTMDDDNDQVTDTTYQNTQNRASDTATWNNNSSMEANNQSVSRYISHVGDKQRMGIDHEYTNSALLHLANAVEYKAKEQNVNIDADLQEIKKEAEKITRDPMAPNHANTIKSAGSRIADAIAKIQNEKFPNLSQDVQEVKTALEQIDNSTLTLDQKDSVNGFFNEAADVLRKMS